MDPKVRQTLLFLSFQVLFCIPIASTTQRDLLGSNDNSLVGKFFFNGLDEWIDRINLTLSSYEEMNVMERISDTCFDHLVHLLNSARDRHPWALRVFDSFGKPGSGIMEGSLSFLGFYSECVDSRAPSRVVSDVVHIKGKEGEGTFPTSRHNQDSKHEGSSLFSGKYCMASIHLPHTALQTLSGVPTPPRLRLGVCFPSTCTVREIQQVASDVITRLTDDASVSITMCSSPSESDITKDMGALVVIAIFALFLAIIVVGTTLDYIKNYHASHREFESSQEYIKRLRAGTIASITSLASIDSDPLRTVVEPTKKKTPSCLRLEDYLIAFSVIENGKKVLKSGRVSPVRVSIINNNNHHHSMNGKLVTSNGSFDVLNGLRVIMMIWIVVLHSYSFAMSWIFFRNPKEVESSPKKILSQFYSNATFSVDSFFFISGLLVTNSCMKQLRRANGKLNLLHFYLHRYLRMTPLMMAIIAFSANLLKYVSQGPSFPEATVMFGAWCHKNWWLNPLYLHNFFRRENMCLSHSWYSAVDMQLYFFAPVILIPLYRRPRIGLAILSLALFSSMVYTAVITVVRHLPAIPFLIDSISSQESMTEYFATVYIKPYARAGPYLVGMAVGFLLFTREGNIRLTSKQATCGWIISSLANIVILFSMVPVYKGYQIPPLISGLYSSTSRVIWALSLAWITVASIAGRGGKLGSFLSSPSWLPWSRLTYAGYLIHPVIMAIFYGSQEAPFAFSHMLMTYFVLGNLILTYAASFLLSILFEAPFVALEQLLSDRRRRSDSNAHVLRRC